MMKRRSILPALFVVPALPAAALALRAVHGGEASGTCGLRCEGEQVTTSVRLHAVDLRGPEAAGPGEGRFTLRCPACGRPVGSGHPGTEPVDLS